MADAVFLPETRHGDGDVAHAGTWRVGREGDAASRLRRITSRVSPSAAYCKHTMARRANYDLLLGCRKDRRSSPARRVITAGSRTAVALLFGRGLWDVNTPYRLIRTSALPPMLARISPTTFAPNVIIAGLAVRDGL